MSAEKYLNPASKSIIINVSPTRVWEVISKPGILELCHPFCKSNPVEKWDGNKSIDMVLYYSGLRYERIFTDWIEGIGYDLLIGRRNGKKSKVIWRISKTNSSSSELRITIFPYYISKYSKFFYKNLFGGKAIKVSDNVLDYIDIKRWLENNISRKQIVG